MVSADRTDGHPAMGRLFLCEKPSQGRDIARVLGARDKGDGTLTGHGVTVTWCFGHLLEMAPPEGYGGQYKHWALDTLPIIPEAWRLEVKADARRQLGIIKGLLAGASEVVIATDADREGETIAREVLQLCQWQGPVTRLWLSALDDASIRKALGALRPGEQTRPLYLAGLGRARADWLVGMNLTRAYTVLGRERGLDGVLSVGRVQTPTLRLVVDRDRAIESFRPVAYWDVLVTFEASGNRFAAKWVPPEAVADPEGRCISEQTARTLAQQLSGRQGVVADTQTKRGREAPPLPYDLGTLQQEADRLFGMGAQQLLDTVQALYETHKAVTYPRTDCPYLPQSMLAESAAALDSLVASDPALADAVAGADRELCSKAWDESKITAHHAIIPTTAACDVSRLNEGERQVYDLIRRRYLAQFYPHHQYDTTTVSLSAEGERFRASGRHVVADGWKVLYPSSREERSDEETDDQALPPLARGTVCPLCAAEAVARQTRPPARFTEGTLIAAMKNVARQVSDARLKQILKETSGLGTEATRAGIIRTLLERGFVQKRKRNLISTDTGRALIDALPEPVKEPGTTALWEQALDEIAQGRGSLDEFVRRQAEWVRAMVERAREGGDLGGVQVQQHACPECGKALRRRKGKSGAFWGCSGYPECQVTMADQGGKPGRPRGQAAGQCRCGGEVLESPKAWRCEACRAIVWKQSFGKKMTETQALALLAGKTVALRGLTSQQGKKYDARAHIENGKIALLFGKDGDPPQGKAATAKSVGNKAAAGDPCPECRKGTMVLRAMRGGNNDGRAFVGCTRYPACRYFAWTG